MSILSTIPLIGDIIKGATDLISESITDKDKKNELEAKLKTIQLNAENALLSQEHEVRLAQIEVNKEEAKSKSIFIAGWRPAVAWVCCAGMGFNFIAQPLLTWCLPILSIWIPEAAQVTPPPPFSLAEMMPVLLGILGLGGMRSFDKAKGFTGKDAPLK